MFYKINKYYSLMDKEKPKNFEDRAIFNNFTTSKEASALSNIIAFIIR